MMKVSVVIPAYNRTHDLHECLGSILEQTVLPLEVIVVDNSDKYGHKIMGLCAEMESRFSGCGVRLHYIQNQSVNALTVAKNLGISHASGDVVSFLDDDIVLCNTYYEEILKFYDKYPQALGVSGRVVDALQSGFKYHVAQFLGKFFLLGFIEKSSCRVLPSLGVTNYLGDKAAACQWISGASTFKKEVFKEFQYDEALVKYSWGEDTDFSFRIYKKYPESLYFAPTARYHHKESPVGRLSNREIICMEEIYTLYLFFKLIDQRFVNVAAYLWGRLGIFLLRSASAIFKNGHLPDIKHSFSAYGLCIKHFNDIRDGDISFFNDTIIRQNGTTTRK